jgi:formylglycine-generating enzyme required for sulfatase activity
MFWRRAGTLIVFAAVLGILLAGCENPSSGSTPAVRETTGRVTVNIGLEGAAQTAQTAQSVAARTVFPDLSGFTSYELNFTATSGGQNHGPVTVTSGSATVTLEAGTYTITATGYTGGMMAVAEGKATGVVVSVGTTASASIILEPKTGTGDGYFSYDITVPNTADTAQLTITSYSDGTNVCLVDFLAGGAGQQTGIISLPAGYYRVTVSLTKGTKNVGFSGEVIHIYTGLTSALGALVYTDANFTEPHTVDAFELTGFFAAPVTGATPVTAPVDTAQYSGTIQWKNGAADHSGAFAAATVYSAEVALTAKPGYTLAEVPAGNFYHGGIYGTGAMGSAGGIVVTITFGATGGGASTGSLNVSIGFNSGAITVTGSSGSNVIYKEGTPHTLILGVTGYEDVQWYVDNNPAAIIANPVILDADNYAIQGHTVTFNGTRYGIPYSQIVAFTVAAANTAGTQTAYTGDGITFKMVYVPGGVTFPTETDDSGTATVAAAYEIGETEVTYELWYAVRLWAESNGYTFHDNPGREGGSDMDSNRVNNTPPSENKQEPVTDVNWFDAVVWLNALTEWVNEKTGSSLDPAYYYDGGYSNVAKNSNSSLNFGKPDLFATAWAKPGATGFRLPTRDEWELAARWRGGDTTNTVSGYTNPYFTKGNSASGATADYNDGTATGAVAWYNGNASSKTQAVKGKAANGLGLYDMSGNVCEWCYDQNPSYHGWSRSIRGGSWIFSASDLLVGEDINNNPTSRGHGGGIRPARTAQ